jgi:hypothetical protein
VVIGKQSCSLTGGRDNGVPPHRKRRKEMHINHWFVIGVGFMLYTMGIAVESVGKMGSCEAYGWDTPVAVGLFMVAIFITGFLAGKK